MNERSLARLLADLDVELEHNASSGRVALDIIERVEVHAPGSVLRAAAKLELRSLGCASLPCRIQGSGAGPTTASRTHTSPFGNDSGPS